MLTFKSACYIQPVKPASPTHCTICETPLQGAYCYTCGQKHTGEKAGVWILLQEALGTFFSLEKSGAATLWLLLRHPQRVVMNYVNGNRGYWQPPNKLVFYSLVLYGLHVSLIDKEVLNLTIEVEGVNPSLFFLGLVLPFLVLSAWLLYGAKPANFARHLVSNGYFWSTWFILLTLLGDAIDAVYLRDWGTVDFFLFLFLVSWSEARVFAASKAWWRKMLLSFTQVVLFFVLLATFAGLIYLTGGRVSSMEGKSPVENQELSN